MESKVRKGIGLVAHDAMKKDLIEWVLWNSELLMGKASCFVSLLCTLDTADDTETPWVKAKERYDTAND